MPGVVCAARITQESLVIIGDRTFFGTAFSRFSAFAVIKIQWHIFAGVPIQTAVMPLAAVEKELVVAHSQCFCSRSVYR